MENKKRLECECGCEDCQNTLTRTFYPQAGFYGFLMLSAHDGTTGKGATSNLSRGQALELAADIYEALSPKEREHLEKLIKYRMEGA